MANKFEQHGCIKFCSFLLIKICYRDPRNVFFRLLMTFFKSKASFWVAHVGSRPSKCLFKMTSVPSNQPLAKWQKIWKEYVDSSMRTIIKKIISFLTWLQSVMESARRPSWKTWTCISLLCPGSCNSVTTSSVLTTQILSLGPPQEVDEIWVYDCSHEIKQQSWDKASVMRQSSSHGHGWANSHQDQRRHTGRSGVQQKACSLFYIKGTAHQQCVSPSSTVNSDFYCDILRHLREDMRWKIPQL